LAPFLIAAHEARQTLPSELILRVASAVLLVPFALAISWADRAIFAGVIAAGAVILASEWSRMTDKEGGDLAFGLLVVGVAGPVIAASAGYGMEAMILCLTAAAGSFLFGLRRGKARSAAFGVLYIGLPGLLLVMLRLYGEPIGPLLVTALFVAVWGADIGAFAAGRIFRWGKLPASISAQKTISGLLGGLMLGTASALFVWPRAFEGHSFVWIMAGALGVASAAVMGDLLESAIKRHYGVKDSGSLIPGHGGLLDRLDSLLIGTPPFALFAWTMLSAGDFA
jgi:phosphatidate cytidylyltransferase